MLKAYLWLTTLGKNDEGASAVEYGIMVALIAAIIVGVVGTIGRDLLAAFTTVANNIP